MVDGSGSGVSASQATSPGLAGRKRRKPSATEQARREAWGRKWGPLVGESIKKAIREAE